MSKKKQKIDGLLNWFKSDKSIEPQAKPFDKLAWQVNGVKEANKLKVRDDGFYTTIENGVITYHKKKK